jgi:hypothetical protein
VTAGLEEDGDYGSFDDAVLTTKVGDRIINFESVGVWKKDFMTWFSVLPE